MIYTNETLNADVEIWLHSRVDHNQSIYFFKEYFWRHNMKPGFDIHQYEKRYKLALENMMRKKLIGKNKQHILDFLTFCELDGMSLPRRERYIDVLTKWSELLDVSFEVATKTDMIRGVGLLQNSKYRPWTKSTYKSMLKRFYKWLLGEDEEYPSIVKWVKCRIKASEIERPKNDDLLTEDEVMQMIKACNHPRDKALIAVLYESGCRVGEIGSMQICDVVVDAHGAKLHVNGKTGPRDVRIISAVPFLTQWIDIHPLRSDSDSALWINYGNTNFCKIMHHRNIGMVLKRSAERCNITKKVNPHRLRHARASFLADYLTEFQMNQHFGWIQGSNMPATYVHMSGRKIDERLLTMQGVTIPESTEVEMKPQICPRCSCINSHEAQYCMKCSATLSVDVALALQNTEEEEQKARDAVDSRMREMLQDETFREMFMKMVERGSKDEL